MFLYGYRYGEVGLPALPAIESSAKIFQTQAARDLTHRPAMQVSLGCHVCGIAQPHPDNGDPDTIEAGVRKRFVLQPPKPDPERLKKFSQFVAKWCKDNLTPLSPDCDTSIESWLLKTNYPEARANELRQLWAKNEGILTPGDFVVKSFIKDETYEEYKHARIINSRTDMFKCAVGPIFRLIEEVVFKHPAFIKKIPVADRPAYIKKMLVREGAKYFWADFTSFESHFTPEIMRNVEFVMYRHMVQHLPGGSDFMKLMEEVLAGENICVLRYLLVKVLGRRMSGEMNTSLGNGFTNLMLLLFLFSELGEEVHPAVEGDDSNSSYMKRCPTVQDFADLGFTIKCGSEDNFEEMSFCGMVFDPSDLVNVTNPIKVLATFGWARSAYTRYGPKKLNVLLRCKALSYLHQYPGAPIIQSLALYALRVTRGVDVRHFIKNDRAMSIWERNEYMAAYEAYKVGLPTRDVPINTRLLVERLYNITADQQRKAESYLDGLSTLRNIDPVELGLDFPQVYRDYYEKYSLLRSRTDIDLDHPHEFWPKMRGFEPEFRRVYRTRSP